MTGRVCSWCRKVLKTIRLYFSTTLIGCLSGIILYFLHWNFSSKSVWDTVYEMSCTNSQNVITCSIIYGLFENMIFFTGLICVYQIICHWHWKWRYHSDIRNLINKMNEHKSNNNDNNAPKQSKPIEETTRGLGYNLDPLIITFPWLMSPILKWNSLTNLLIHLSYYITYYNLPSISNTSDSATDIEPYSWKITYSEIEIIELNFPKIINPFPADYNYNDNLTLHYSVFRTLWSFVIYCVLDYILWKERYGLTYLFETGINKVMQQYAEEHCALIDDLLLTHVQYIKDLSKLIVEFHGNRLEQFILIKVKLHECLKYFKLELLFNILTVFTVLASSMRIYYTPVVVNLMNPVCYILGITAFVILVVILVFNGIGSDAMHLLREFEQVFNYSTHIGAIVFCLIWGVVVWKNMRQKKVALMQQQSRSLVKDILNKIFQDPKLRKQFDLSVDNIDSTLNS
eukprot:533628_1